jgi:hypothetical protein
MPLMKPSKTWLKLITQEKNGSRWMTLKVYQNKKLFKLEILKKINFIMKCSDLF